MKLKSINRSLNRLRGYQPIHVQISSILRPEGDLGGDSIKSRREKPERVVTTTLAHIGSTMVHSAMRREKHLTLN